MDPIRRAGRATTASGATLTWSEAEGSRGTRWREAITDKGILVRSLLLEVSPAGRPTRLEVTTLAGLLTLHLEVDESALHGNVVTPHGVRHLSFDWSAYHALVVVESPACVAAMLRGLALGVAAGAAIELDGVRFDDALEPLEARWRVTRNGGEAWRLRSLDATDDIAVRTDPEGRPILAGAQGWPLEI
jgi:hypothetical protein